MEKKIRDFILNGCNASVKNDSQYTYEVETMIFTAKSLLPCLEDVGNRIDYFRFNEELKLWFYYRNGGNRNLINFYNWCNDVYWGEDDSIYSRLVPIVFANEKWDIVVDEVIKNILFTTGNISCLFEGIALAKLLSLVLNDSDFNDIKLKLKEEIINFSQVNYINTYKDYYKDRIDNYPGNYRVHFEKERINLLNILNSQSFIASKYRILRSCLNMLDHGISKENKVQNFFIFGFKGLLGEINDKNKIHNDVFLKNLAGYLYKLRKGKIHPSNLKIDKYILPDIFSFKTGDKFFHSLLNNCKVINRMDSKDKIVIYVKSKSGIYKFKSPQEIEDFSK